MGVLSSSGTTDWVWGFSLFAFAVGKKGYCCYVFVCWSSVHPMSWRWMHRITTIIMYSLLWAAGAAAIWNHLNSLRQFEHTFEPENPTSSPHYCCSGVDMTSRPFMYIDLIRTAQISGGDALDDVVGGIGENLTDKSGSYNSEKLHFCLDGMIPASTTTTTTAASTTGWSIRIVNRTVPWAATCS